MMPTAGVPAYWNEAKEHLRRADPLMAAIIREHEEPPLKSKGQLFETLAHSIVGQQISALAADAIWRRLVELLGTVTPENITRASTESMRGVGLSGRTVEYLKGLADANDELEQLPWTTMNDDEVHRALCRLRGIGPWTADMILIFSLCRPDILPLGDIGVVRVMERLYADGARLNAEQLTEIAEPWRPFRTVATWYLWRSLDPEPVEY